MEQHQQQHHHSNDTNDPHHRHDDDDDGDNEPEKFCVQPQHLEQHRIHHEKLNNDEDGRHNGENDDENPVICYSQVNDPTIANDQNSQEDDRKIHICEEQQQQEEEDPETSTTDREDNCKKNGISMVEDAESKPELTKPPQDSSTSHEGYIHDPDGNPAVVPVRSGEGSNDCSSNQNSQVLPSSPPSSPPPSSSPSCPQSSPPSSSPSSSSSPSPNKTVNFSHVETRYYPITIGDNPSVSHGIPLTIDWHYDPTETTTEDITVYSSITDLMKEPKSHDDLILPPLQRLQRLRRVGYTLDELKIALSRIHTKDYGY